MVELIECRVYVNYLGVWYFKTLFIGDRELVPFKGGTSPYWTGETR
jgi:hypothetical protein